MEEKENEEAQEKEEEDEVQVQVNQSPAMFSSSLWFHLDVSHYDVILEYLLPL